MQQKTRPSFCFLLCAFLILLSAELLFVSVEAKGVIFDTDGSLEDLLTISSLLQKPFSGSNSPLKQLVTISSFGGSSWTHTSSAYDNVRNFLATVHAESFVDVSIGSMDTWGTRRNISTGLSGSCPSTILSSSSSSSSMFFTPFEQDTLFGFSEELSKSSTSGGMEYEDLLGLMMDQQVLTTSSSSTNSEKEIKMRIQKHNPGVKAIKSLIDSLGQNDWERIDYVAMSGLTNIADFLQLYGSDRRYLSRINLHIISKTKISTIIKSNNNKNDDDDDLDDNFQIDPLAANFVLTFPNLPRTLYLQKNLAQPVELFDELHWSQIMNTDSPKGILVLLQALQAKKNLFSEAVKNLEKETTPQTIIRFPGPVSALLTYTALDKNVKEVLEENVVAKIWLEKQISTSVESWTLNMTVLTASHSDPLGTHVFKQPSYTAARVFWTRFIGELGKSAKWWMDYKP